VKLLHVLVFLANLAKANWHQMQISTHQKLENLDSRSRNKNYQAAIIAYVS